MAEASPGAILTDLNLPEIEPLELAHEDRKTVVSHTGIEEGDVLNQIEGEFLKVESIETGKDKFYQLNKELIAVYSQLLEELAKTIPAIKNESNEKLHPQIVKDAVAKIIGILRSDSGRTGLNVAAFESVASLIERHQRNTKPMAMVWFPRKIRRHIGPLLNEAKENISKTKEVPKIVESVRGLVNQIITLSKTLEDKLKEISTAGRENVLKLAPLHAMVLFLQELRKEFNTITAENEIDPKAIEAEVRKERENDIAAIEKENSAAAVAQYSNDNDREANNTEAAITGSMEKLEIEIQSEKQKRIDAKKEEIARQRGFPEGLVKLQQQLEDVQSRRNNLFLLVETQKLLSGNVINALASLKRKKTDPAINNEEMVQEIVELLMTREINTNVSIPLFRSLKGIATSLDPENDLAVLAKYFGIEIGELTRMVVKTTQELEAKKATLRGSQGGNPSAGGIGQASETSPKTTEAAPATPVGLPVEEVPAEEDEEDLDAEDERIEDEEEQEDAEETGVDETEEGEDDDEDDQDEPQAPPAPRA